MIHTTVMFSDAGGSTWWEDSNVRTLVASGEVPCKLHIQLMVRREYE